MFYGNSFVVPAYTKTERNRSQLFKDSSGSGRLAHRCDHGSCGSCIAFNGSCCMVLTVAWHGRHGAITCGSCWSMLDNQSQDPRHCFFFSQVPDTLRELVWFPYFWKCLESGGMAQRVFIPTSELVIGGLWFENLDLHFFSSSATVKTLTVSSQQQLGLSVYQTQIKLRENTTAETQWKYFSLNDSPIIKPYSITW